MTAERAARRRWLGVTFLLLLFLSGFLAFYYLPGPAYLSWLLAKVRRWGPLGLLAYVGLYLLAAVLGVPGSLLTLGAGFAWGVGWGTVAASTGATLGAAAAFLVGRYLLRPEVERRLHRQPRFRALDQAVAQHGFRLVLLTRLSPLFPYNLLNYAFSITQVSFRAYFWASWLGMLPGALLYTYLGQCAGDLTALAAGIQVEGPAYYVWLGLGLLVTLLLTGYVCFLARRALTQVLPTTSPCSHPVPQEQEHANSESIHP